MKAKGEARRVVRNAQNVEWIEIGKSLQEDFQRKQRRFWRRVTNKNGERVGSPIPASQQG